MKRLFKLVVAGMMAAFPLLGSPVLAQENTAVTIDNPENTSSEESAVENPLDAVTVVDPKRGDIALPPEEDLTIVPDDGLGSIRITLTDAATEGRSKANVEFGLAEVADIEKGEYVLKAPFDESELNINKLQYARDLEAAAKALKDYVEEPEQTVKTNEEGKASFENLEVGVYLLYAIDVAEYDVIAPFLVSIPSWSETDKIMLYDVDVQPKHSHLPVIDVQKVDSATGKNITSRKFEFTSFSDPECTDKILMVPGDPDKGSATFTITYGTFYIKETAAPQGYLISDEVIKVEFNEDGVFINDELKEPDDDYLYNISYKNSLLPIRRTNTGVGNHVFLYIAVGALSLAGVIVFTAQRKKNN